MKRTASPSSSSGSPFNSDDRRRLGRRQDLDAGETRVAEQELADGIAVDRPSGRQVVLDDQPAGLGEVDDLLERVLPRVREHEPERSTAVDDLAPVAGQQLDVLEAREALARSHYALGI